VHYACASTDAARAGFDDRHVYEELAHAHGERTLPMVQIMRDEALSTFQAWLDKPDRIAY
jgi:hypothetical protein